MENSSISIKNWSEDDRPREKLMLKGKSVLSDAELIAILIGGHLQTLFKAFMQEKTDFERISRMCAGRFWRGRHRLPRQKYSA